jgi:hypothetical protein
MIADHEPGKGREMSTSTTAARPSATEASRLSQAPAERYIPKVTHIDPDLALRPARDGERRGWAARVPVLNWFVGR